MKQKRQEILKTEHRSDSQTMKKTFLIKNEQLVKN